MIRTGIKKGGYKGRKNGGPCHAVAHAFFEHLNTCKVVFFVCVLTHEYRSETAGWRVTCERLMIHGNYQWKVHYVGAEELVKGEWDAHEGIHQQVSNAEPQVVQCLHA